MQPIEDRSGDGELTEDGVDVTLIRWFLSLTRAERLASLQQFAPRPASHHKVEPTQGSAADEGVWPTNAPFRW